MFPLGRLRLIRDPTRIDHLIEQASPLILTSLIRFVIIHGVMLIQLSNGGSDLVSADIPKSLMLLQGENPYSVNPWASPYPPLLLLVDSGIIRTASLFNPQSTRFRRISESPGYSPTPASPSSSTSISDGKPPAL